MENEEEMHATIQEELSKHIRDYEAKMEQPGVVPMSDTFLGI